MIKELVKLATHLDSKGYSREASYLDKILEKAASPVKSDEWYDDENETLADKKFRDDNRDSSLDQGGQHLEPMSLRELHLQEKERLSGSLEDEEAEYMKIPVSYETWLSSYMAWRDDGPSEEDWKPGMPTPSDVDYSETLEAAQMFILEEASRIEDSKRSTREKVDLALSSYYNKKLQKQIGGSND